MKTKWIGLEAYNLKLFLIKNRFFMSGKGLEKNANKLLALGFREVPKSAFRSGTRSYWSAPSESGFLRRVVAAFPEYTVEMLPPEAINPTILVNRSQNFKGNNNVREQLDERTSHTGQPVVETTSGSTHATSSGDATVLVDDGARDDTRDQSSANVGESGVGQLSGLAAGDSGSLRGSGTTAPREVEATEPTDGVSEPAGTSELEQSGEDGQSGSVSEHVSSEPRAVNADERGSGLLLSDTDIKWLENAVSKRLELVERLHNDTQKLTESVVGAIEGGDHQRHAELREAYDKLDAQEASFELGALFFGVDSQEGVYAPVLAMGNEAVVVGEARAALTNAGYGWLSEHIKPVLSFSRDDSKDEVTVDRVKQIIVTQFADKAGLQSNENAQRADQLELESRVARAELLVRLVDLERIGRAALQQENVAQTQQGAVDEVADELANETIVEAANETTQEIVEEAESEALEQPVLDKEALIAEFAAKGGIELFGVTHWINQFDIDAATLRSILDKGYDKRSLFQFVANRVYPNFELMDALANRDRNLAIHYRADHIAVKSLSDEAFGALLNSDNYSANEKTAFYAYLVLRGSDKKADFEYIANLGQMATGRRLNAQKHGGKLQRMAEPYLHLDTRSPSNNEAPADEVASVDIAQEDAQLVDLEYIETAFEAYKSLVNDYKTSMEGLEETANSILASEDYTKAQDALTAFDALSRTRESIDLVKTFEDAAGEDGVMAVFNSFGGSVTSFAQARNFLIARYTAVSLKRQSKAIH